MAGAVCAVTTWVVLLDIHEDRDLLLPRQEACCCNAMLCLNLPDVPLDAFGLSNFQKTFFETSSDSSSFNGYWISFVQCKPSVICFGSLRLVTFKEKKMLPSVLRVFALTSSNKIILWCSSVCPSFLSLQSRLEDSLADLVLGDLEGKSLGVESSVISVIGYFCISSINLHLYNKRA